MLKVASSGPGLQSLFAVLFVATVLTIYEVTMFYKVVVPEVNTKINEGIQGLSQSLKESSIVNVENQLRMDNYNIINTLKENRILKDVPYDAFIQNKQLLDTKDALYNILEIGEEREGVLTAKINNYTKVTGVGMVVTLCIGLYMIHAILRGRGEYITGCSWTIIATTIVLILAFQYLFYLLGTKYKYLGSMGDEELLYYIYSFIN